MSKVIASTQTLTAATQNIRHVVDEEAEIWISYNGVRIDNRSTYCSWSQHCTANAVEEALEWCKRFRIERDSKLVIEVEYRMFLIQQVQVKFHELDWRYDPLDDPRWKRMSGHKTLEDCVVWRSDQNIDWSRY